MSHDRFSRGAIDRDPSTASRREVVGGRQTMVIRSTHPWRQRVSAATLRLFAGTLLISLLAKGGAFQQAFGFDDWGFALGEKQAAALLWQARVGGALVVRLTQFLQLDSVHSQFVWVAALIACQALLGTILARFWHLHRNPWAGLAVASLAAIHPYTCDSLHMRSALGVATLSLALVAILLLPERWTAQRLLAGTLLFTVAVSIYQLALHYLIMAALMGAAVSWGRYLLWASSRGWPVRARRLAHPRNILRHKSTALLACAFGGTALYGAIAFGYIAWRHVPLTTRTQLLPLGWLGERSHQVAQVITQQMLGSEPLIPRTAQWLLLGILGLTVFGLLRCVRAGSFVRAAATATMALVFLAGSLVWTLGLVLVLKEFWPAPRVVAPVAIFWAGVLALSCLLYGRLGRRVVLAGSAVILLAFVGIDNRVFTEQVRLNRRDTLQATRIAERLEGSPGFSPTSRLIVRGKSWGYPLGLRTVTYDLNVSAFGAQWAQAQILRESTGYAFAEPTAADIKVATDHCDSVSPFPGPESVVVLDHVAIVCVGN
jgi:hypothetical protein